MDLISGISAPTIGVDTGIAFIFKLLCFVLLTGYVFYAFLLTLRIRILADTVSAGPNKLVMMTVYIHLVGAVVGSFVAFLIALSA